MIMNLVIVVFGLFIMGAVLIGIIHRRHGCRHEQVKRDWIKYGIFIIVVAAFLTVAIMGQWALLLLLGLLIVLSARELWHQLSRRYRYGIAETGICVTVVITGLAHLLWFESGVWFASCVFVLLIVFVTDSYAQLIGRLVGRHRLCPRVSPHKTIEGFLGGLIMAVAVALTLSFLLPHLSPGAIVALAIITALSATAGDLLFSLFKRKLGIKDFSGFLPGHGGVLDRFDSLIAAAPAFYWGQHILNRVLGGAS